MNLLNLGCGLRFHPSWTNVDFVTSNDNILAHNLLLGIPFEDDFFDAVYHSHVLEHFTKYDGPIFLKECFRVLKTGGIIRIAIPDLESIARNYLTNLELALQGDEMGAYNYEWMKLELYDQTVRNQSGGEMAKYIFQETIPNEDYVYQRIGEEGRNMRNNYLKNKVEEGLRRNAETKVISVKETFFEIVTKKTKQQLKNFLFKDEIQRFKNLEKEAEIGKFRLGGEVHQWMYDRYSLSQLLNEVGFSCIIVRDAFTSGISSWTSYELDTKNGIIFKPDSLYMEAKK